MIQIHWLIFKKNQPRYDTENVRNVHHNRRTGEDLKQKLRGITPISRQLNL